jgi:hypothetical protein
MKKNSLKNVIAIIAVVVSIFLNERTLQAANVMTDDFSSVSNLNSDGWYFASASAAGTAWTTATDNTTPLSGTVLSNVSPGTSANTLAYKQFSAVTLSNIGDSITVQLAFHMPATASSGGFSVSLLNSTQTMTTDIFGSSVLTDAKGYGVYDPILTGATSPTYWRVTGNSPLPYATKLYTTPESVSANDNAGHVLTLSLLKTSTGIEIQIKIDQTILSSFTDIGSTNFSYNTLRLSGGVGKTLDFDNIIVSSVPEPSSVALIGVTALAFLIYMRNVKSGSDLKI